MALRRCLRESGLIEKALKRAYRQNSIILEGQPGRSFGFGTKIFILVFFNRLLLFFCILAEIYRLLPEWLTELFRFCPDKKRFSLAEDFLIIGHRGNPLKKVENTIEACAYAVNNQKANAVEIDLCLTKDGQIVLWHDWDPNTPVSYIRQAGLEPGVAYKPFVPAQGQWRKPVNRLTLDELRSHYGYSLKKGKVKKLNIQIPTLEAFYVWAIRQTRLKYVFFDVKIPASQKLLVKEFIAQIKKLNDKYKPSFKMVFLTPEEVIIRMMKKITPDLHCSLDVILPFGLTLDPSAFSSIKRARDLQNTIASVGKPTAIEVAPWTTYRTLIGHDRNLMENDPQKDERLYAWTINKRKELACLARMGINGIITDRPERLFALIQKLLAQNH